MPPPTLETRLKGLGMALKEANQYGQLNSINADIVTNSDSRISLRFFFLGWKLGKGGTLFCRENSKLFRSVVFSLPISVGTFFVTCVAVGITAVFDAAVTQSSLQVPDLFHFRFSKKKECLLSNFYL